MKKGISLITALSLLSVNVTFAETTWPEFMYMEKGANKWEYNFVFSKEAYNPYKYSFEINWTKLLNPEVIQNWSKITLKNLYKSWDKITLKEVTVNTASGASSQANTEKKLSDFNFRSEDNTYMIANPTLQTINYLDALQIKLNPSNNFNINTDPKAINKDYLLLINWKETKVENPPFMQKYEDTKHYISKDSLTVFKKNLTDAKNTIQLKVDWLYSNYINISNVEKELWAPIKTQLYNDGTSKLYYIDFNIPKGFEDKNWLEIYWNKAKLDPANYTVEFWKVSIKLDLSKFAKLDNIYSVYFKNPTYNFYTNTQVINLYDVLKLDIAKMDISKAWNSINFSSVTNSAGLQWDMNKIKININAVDYSIEWTKSEEKTSTWATIKDSSWNVIYKYINKIPLVKTEKWFAFNLLSSSLSSTWNTLYVKNENTWRESNKIYFNLDDLSSVDYTSKNTVTEVKNESVSFEATKNISEKTVDFLNKPEKDISIWKISLANIKTNEYYDFSFKLKSNLSYNPFKELSYNKIFLDTEIDSDWKIIFVYKFKWLWTELISADIIENINDLFNIDESSINLSLKEMSLKRLETDNTWKTLYTQSWQSDIYIKYKYDFWNCFDWTADHCRMNWLNDPTELFSISSSKEIIENSTSIISTQDNTINQNSKQNIEIVEPSYKSDKFKVINSKFKKLFNLIKSKWFTARQISTCKKAINNILNALKSLEDWASKSDVNKILKESVKAITWVLKSTPSTK